MIEIKLDKSPEEGVRHIREKQYYLPYLKQGQELALVGLSFSSTGRNIDNWEGEVLDEHGALLGQLAPSEKQ